MKKILTIIAVFSLISGLFLAGCSSKPKVSNAPDSDFSIKEYNADVDELTLLLREAQDLDHQLDAMGDTNKFTSQQQVDNYNSLVKKYNAAADKYTAAAKKFNKKYEQYVDGIGTDPTDPDNISAPKKMKE